MKKYILASLLFALAVFAFAAIPADTILGGRVLGVPAAPRVEQAYPPPQPAGVVGDAVFATPKPAIAP